MSNIMRKEMRLSASILAYFFIAFGLMFMLPGYPILCGAFFTCLGLYQSFQYAKEANDIVFSALLPIAKRDVVKAKFAFTCFIELCSLGVMAMCMIARMTIFANSAVYRNNVMMNANIFALGAAFVIFGVFNLIFLGGFFKTAHNINKPFLKYIIVAFLCIGVFETMHHIPGLGAVNAFGTDSLGIQIASLIAGMLIYLLMTMLTFRKACDNFEKIDL